MMNTWRRTLPPFLLVLTAAVLALWAGNLESSINSPFPLAPTVPHMPHLEIPGEKPMEYAATEVPQPFELLRGQTLGDLLGDLGVEGRERYAAIETLSEQVDVRRVRAGEPGFSWFNDAGALDRLRLRHQDRDGRLGWAELARSGDGWESSWHEMVRSVAVERARGELQSALETALRDAGADPRVAFRMSQVLQWDLDFHRDLRRGDQFEVLWESVSLDGEAAAPGEVLALSYENRGRHFEAYRWGEGYYDAEGRPLKKLFLRAPLPFSKVTSKFSKRRFHPVLKTHRPHYGVDYGAPRGTPVQATASGTASFVGATDSAGKMVKISHPNGYLTAYLHLSGFAPGVRKGRHIAQGEVIGYVGSTGWSTGPHLDYRVQKHGQWIDPLKIESTPAEPIPEDKLEEYLARRDELRAKMQG